MGARVAREHERNIVVVSARSSRPRRGMCDDYDALSRGTAARHGWEIMLGAERKACLGMRQLAEAVLDVLFEARRDGERPGMVEISRRAGIFGGKGDAGKGEPGSMAHSIRRMPRRGRDQQTGGDIQQERRCRQGRARERGALDTANARAWPRSAGGPVYSAGKAMPARARLAA